MANNYISSLADYNFDNRGVILPKDKKYFCQKIRNTNTNKTKLSPAAPRASGSFTLAPDSPPELGRYLILDPLLFLS